MLERNPSPRTSGMVFNIQKFSIQDGPGIRTTVFLKGCPLRCAWCSNPESQSRAAEISRNGVRCLGPAACGACLGVCVHKALRCEDGRIIRDPARCADCFACVRVCPVQSVTQVGRCMTAAEVVAAVVADAVFYSFDEGGLTLSGGEALMQPEFAAAICQEGHRHALHTALETCAAVPWENIHLVCRHMDHVMVDLKHMDPRRHKEGTGMDNRLILDNILRLRAEFAELPLTIRCPVIPGFNDSESNIRDTARFVGALSRAKLELLSYHRFGEDKYDNLGRPYALRGLMPPDAEHMRHLRSVAGEYSVMV